MAEIDIPDGVPLKYEQGKVGMKVKIHSSRGKDTNWQQNEVLTIVGIEKNSGAYFYVEGKLKWQVKYGVWPYHLYAVKKPTIIITEE